MPPSPRNFPSCQLHCVMHHRQLPELGRNRGASRAHCVGQRGLLQGLRAAALSNRRVLLVAPCRPTFRIMDNAACTRTSKQQCGKHTTCCSIRTIKDRMYGQVRVTSVMHTDNNQSASLPRHYTPCHKPGHSSTSQLCTLTCNARHASASNRRLITERCSVCVTCRRFC